MVRKTFSENVYIHTIKKNECTQVSRFFSDIDRKVAKKPLFSVSGRLKIENECTQVSRFFGGFAREVVKNRQTSKIRVYTVFFLELARKVGKNPLFSFALKIQSECTQVSRFFRSFTREVMKNQHTREKFEDTFSTKMKSSPLRGVCVLFSIFFFCSVFSLTGGSSDVLHTAQLQKRKIVLSHSKNSNLSLFI